MATTIRQKIVNSIVEALRGITQANGFETNAGEKVDDFQLNWQEDELPAISVCDISCEPAPSEQASIEEKDCLMLQVKIRAMVGSETRAPECRKIIGDILTVVRDNPRWTDSDGTQLTKQNYYVSDEFILNEEAFQIAAAEVTIGVLFWTERFDPYEQ